jgi:hypothetical protein
MRTSVIRVKCGITRCHRTGHARDVAREARGGGDGTPTAIWGWRYVSRLGVDIHMFIGQYCSSGFIVNWRSRITDLISWLDYVMHEKACLPTEVPDSESLVRETVFD